MATDRCWECGRGLRDGACPSCGWERPATGPAAPKQAVHRPTPPRTSPPTAGPRRGLESWRPSPAETEVGKRGVAQAKETLAARQPRPESPVRQHLRMVAGGLGRPPAVTAAGDVLDEIADHEERHQ